MKIILKQLILLNFKGIRSLTVNFDQITDIYGQNGKGKTSVLDAWSWLMTGKDSANSADFEIKTLDENGEAYSKLSHEVAGTLLIDGEENVIRKIYREKWTKKKGTAVEMHDGHTTEHYWNDVPMSEKAFKEKILSYITESRFRLLTNLRYFNELLKWPERRQGLLTLAGGIEDMDVAQQLNMGGKYDHLIAALTAKKSVDEYKKEIGAKVKKIKEDSESLPARIDEARRGLPEEEDYDGITLRIHELSTELGEVEEQLMNQTETQRKKQEEITTLYKNKEELNRYIITLENNIRNAVRDQKQVRETRINDLRRGLRRLLDERSSFTNAFNTKTREKERLESEKLLLEQQRNTVSAKWDEEDAKVFKMDPHATECPTCQQHLPNAMEIAEQLQSNFNKAKAETLATLSKKGKSLVDEIAEKEKSIALKQIEIDNVKADSETTFASITQQENEVATYEAEHVRLSANEDAQVVKEIEASKDIAAVRAKINLIDQQINAPAAEDTARIELMTRKNQLTADIRILNNKLSTKQQRETTLTRIAELEQREESSAQSLADLENLLFSLQEFDKAKMDMLEDRINGKFQMVKFRLFDRQVNGGEAPTCVALINGVPYSDANTASKINANLDIINVFSEHFDTTAPVFIDNRESVTEIIQTDLQIINLIVSPTDTRLRVGNSVKVPQSELFS